MRTTFVNELLNEAKRNNNLELLTGDLGFGVLKEFIEHHSDHFTNCGIAEQNMLSMAGGMASLGKCVVVYSIGNFPTIRPLEQIRNDICYYNHDVKIVCVGGGYTYGSLGMSHHATEDIAAMRSMPNMYIFTPSDKNETLACVKKMFELHCPCYLRLERDSNNIYNKNANTENILNCQHILDFGSSNCIFTFGTIIEEVYDMAKENKLDLFTLPCLKPIDEEQLLNTLSKYKSIISIEEHSIIGGLGDLLCSVVASNTNCSAKVHKIGIKDRFLSDVGDQKYMRKCAEIDKESINSYILRLLGK